MAYEDSQGREGVGGGAQVWGMVSYCALYLEGSLHLRSELKGRDCAKTRFPKGGRLQG
jgi:hypothetical protein